MPELRFQQWLLEANLVQLEQACVDPLIGATSIRKQQIRDQLLLLHKAPQPFEQLMVRPGLLTVGRRTARRWC